MSEEPHVLVFIAVCAASLIAFVYFLHWAHQQTEEEIAEERKLNRLKKAKKEEAEEVSLDDDPCFHLSQLELTEIVTNVTDYEEFSRLVVSIDVYEDTNDKNILISDFSKELYDKYCKGILLLLSEQYTEQEIEEHLDDDLLENYIDTCISIGTKVICKELGITAPKNEDNNRGSTLRKTKKWK